MDRALAEMLIAELEKHAPLSPEVLKGDRGKLVDALAATEVPPSKKFYEEVKPNQIYIPDTGMDKNHFVSIRRVLRNNLARDYQLSELKKYYEAAVSLLGIHDSDIWTRKLRRDSDLVRMMVQCGQQYSLLAKLETFDEFSRKVAARPIVVIPNAPDLQKILDWEDANTDYDKEGLFGIRGISKRQYFKLG